MDCEAPGRHQGGRKGPIGQPARHQGDTREAGKDRLDSLGGTREQERTIWTACEAPGRHQRGRKGPMDNLIEAPGRQEPARHQGGTREAGKDQLDSLRGTREAPGRQERTNWTACEAPGRHQGGRNGPFGQPGRHQGGTREAETDYLDSLGGTREAPGPLKAILCYNPAEGLSL